MINTVAVEPTFEAGQCKTQTADYCFPHANEYVTTIVPLFSNPKNNSPQSVRSLHFTLPRFPLAIANIRRCLFLPFFQISLRNSELR